MDGENVQVLWTKEIKIINFTLDIQEKMSHNKTTFKLFFFTI